MLKLFTESQINELSGSGDFLLKEDLEDYNRDVSVCMKLPESTLKKSLEKRLLLEWQVLVHKGVSTKDEISALVEAGLRFIRIARQYYKKCFSLREHIHDLFPIKLPWNDHQE